MALDPEGDGSLLHRVLLGDTQQPTQLLHERWYFLGCGCPDDLRINFKVTVNEAISHRLDRRPGNVRSFGANVLGYVSRRLANDLNRSNIANKSMRSELRSACVRQTMKSATVSEASIMCCRRVRSLSRILHFGCSYNFVTKVPAKITRSPKIHGFTKHLRKLLLHLRDGDEAWSMARLKLDQEVYIAILVGCPFEGGAKKRQSADVMPFAKASHELFGNIQFHRHVLVPFFENAQTWSFTRCPTISYSIPLNRSFFPFGFLAASRDPRSRKSPGVKTQPFPLTRILDRILEAMALECFTMAYLSEKQSCFSDNKTNGIMGQTVEFELVPLEVG